MCWLKQIREQKAWVSKQTRVAYGLPNPCPRQVASATHDTRLLGRKRRAARPWCLMLFSLGDPRNPKVMTTRLPHKERRPRRSLTYTG
jgi:hypothetical protein